MSHQVSLDAANALVHGQKFSNGSTVVTVNSESVIMSLHGYAIAEHLAGDIIISNAGYPTTVTHSRLNAVLEANDCACKVKRKDGQTIIVNNHKSLRGTERVFPITLDKDKWVVLGVVSDHFNALIKTKMEGQHNG